MAETRVLNGSEILIECLKEQGVKTVFGYPGGAILNIYDALYKHQDEITHILTSHEQGASHAAEGYGKGWCVPGYFRPGCYQPGNWYCDRIHGFHPNGSHYL